MSSAYMIIWNPKYHDGTISRVDKMRIVRNKEEALRQVEILREPEIWRPGLHVVEPPTSSGANIEVFELLRATIGETHLNGESGTQLKSNSNKRGDNQGPT